MKKARREGDWLSGEYAPFAAFVFCVIGLVAFAFWRDSREESRPVDVAADEKTPDPVPLAEWLKVYGLDIGEKLAASPVRVVVERLGGNVVGRYEAGIAHLDPVSVSDPRLHRGVLMHEIAHRYCGWHNGPEWAACAASLGVPERFQSDNVGKDTNCWSWMPEVWDQKGDRIHCNCYESDLGVEWECKAPESKP